MADATTLTLNNIGNAIAAIAALGTASMGLVDALKVLGRFGPSNIGFHEIHTQLTPFLPEQAAGAYNLNTLLEMLRANWFNGVDKAEQKARAKSLIHLGLTKGNASQLAAAAGVDPGPLQSVAAKSATGNNATTQELNVLGQFDAILSAVLDAAYERADQKYRNGCKAIATGLATLLGVIAGGLIESWTATGLLTGAAVGLISVPLAPVSKDLVTSLQAAAAALQKTNRVKV
jgi:hypothetical protein